MAGKGHTNQIRIMTTAEAIVGTTDSNLEAHRFVIGPSDFVGSAFPKVSAWKNAGLGAITVTIWEKVLDNWNQVYKDGAVSELTATNPQESIVSYGVYSVAKASATTGVEVTVTRVR